VRLTPLRAALLAATVVAPHALGAQSRCEPAFQPAADSLAQMTGELGLGGAALVLRHEGRVVCEVYTGGFGVTTEVPLVSAAKWLSAATILTLVDDGRLKLDEPIGKRLSYFKGNLGAITLRQLLSLTSGLPGLHPCMTRADLTLDECARDIAKQARLSGPPGSAFAYGGMGFTVAGRLAEVADGKPWAEVFRARMAEPLGMRHTGYGATANPMLSEGLAYSTAEEYSRMLQMVLDGGTWDGRRILSAEAVEEMTRDQTAGAEIAASPRGTTTYGLGCWRDVVDSATGRALVLTSPGAGGFIPWINRARGLAGVVAAYDRLDRVWPRAVGIMMAARNAVAQADTAGVGQP
jgi:CubicO group peptidase (beta-lactamase class C family)